MLSKAERGGWLGSRRLLEVVTGSSSTAVLCWQSLSCPGGTSGSVGALYTAEVSGFPGLFAVLWLAGEEGDCVYVSQTWFADRKVSFFAQH